MNDFFYMEWVKGFDGSIIDSTFFFMSGNSDFIVDDEEWLSVKFTNSYSNIYIFNNNVSSEDKNIDFTLYDSNMNISIAHSSQFSEDWGSVDVYMKRSVFNLSSVLKLRGLR